MVNSGVYGFTKTLDFLVDFRPENHRIKIGSVNKSTFPLQLDQSRGECTLTTPYRDLPGRNAQRAKG